MTSRLFTILFTALSALTVSSAALPVAHAASFSAGVSINEDVDAEETGLRVYPGATPVEKKKRDGDSANNKGETDSANIRFTFGEYGLKVVAAKLRSTDSPEKVAAFYRSDLARFGDVLDCSAPNAANATETESPKDKKSKVLRCDKDKARKNGMLYKAGRKDNQHVVDIKPYADGSEFSLVHVKVRAPD